jgi:hypothetical protein
VTFFYHRNSIQIFNHPIEVDQLYFFQIIMKGVDVGELSGPGNGLRNAKTVEMEQNTEGTKFEAY